MLDSNWDLINGEDAHEIEVLNYANQVNVIEALVRFVLHHGTVTENGCDQLPNLAVLREFHRTATLFLLQEPGQYRTGPVHIGTPTGEIVYVPPSAEDVVARLDEFYSQLQQGWGSLKYYQVGAFVLWFVNWVHPFKNGNGRTARAFCYACMSLKLGFVLPGTPTIIDLIMQRRDDYYAALRIADVSYQTTGTPDLEPLSAMVATLLEEQLASVPA